MAISRLPSHGLRFGSPPKLQGHEIVQLQLSATVAVMCQSGAAARGGALRATSPMVTAASRIRMVRRVQLPRAQVNGNIVTIPLLCTDNSLGCAHIGKEGSMRRLPPCVVSLLLLLSAATVHAQP